MDAVESIRAHWYCSLAQAQIRTQPATPNIVPVLADAILMMARPNLPPLQKGRLERPKERGINEGARCWIHLSHQSRSHHVHFCGEEGTWPQLSNMQQYYQSSSFISLGLT
jgi:hypothetical protein